MNWNLLVSDAAAMYGTNLENQMQDTCGCPALMIDMVDFVIFSTFLISFSFLRLLTFVHCICTHTLLD